MANPPLLAGAAVLLAAVPGAASGPVAPARAVPAGQFLIREQVVIRMQRPPPRPVEWREKKGPKCVAVDALAGALVVEDDAVDLVLDGGRRLRARLADDCPSLAFYRGFYLKPMRDGKVCAGRDAIRSRTGQMCEVRAFRRLVVRR